MQRMRILFLLIVGTLETLAWVRWTTFTALTPTSRPRRKSELLSPLYGRRSPRNNEGVRPSSFDSEKPDLNLILIDHYDSFTYNLADLLSQLCRHPPLVLAADCADSWEDLSQACHLRNWTRIDGVVLSPGPGKPDMAGKLSRDVIQKNPDLPILGVCLGHQILGLVYGAVVKLAPEPVHGQVRPVRVIDLDDPLWKGVVPSSLSGTKEGIEVTRYHSLHVTNIQQATGLIPTAVSEDEDNILMSMRHRENPHYGVQFHPESIGTPQGKELLRNFCRICEEMPAAVPSPKEAPIAAKPLAVKRPASASRHQVLIHKVCGADVSGRIQPSDVMKEFLSDSDFSFWLDDSQAAASDEPSNATTVSILGSGRERVEYWGKEKPSSRQGLYLWPDGSDTPCCFPNMDILTYLQQEYSAPTVEATLVSFGGNDNAVSMKRYSEEHLHDTLPFSFRGGHVGFLGYEVRHDTARFLEDEERGRHRDTVKGSHCTSDPHSPTAAFLWADRSFVYDHRNGEWYLVCVSSPDSTRSKQDTLDWMKATVDKLCTLSRTVNGDSGDPHQLPVQCSVSMHVPPSFRPNRSRTTYKNNFKQCIEHIRQGDSYELCLTNQLQASVPRLSPSALYELLRQRNPAPHSGYLNWNSAQRALTGTPGALAICSSSPERFVSVERMKGVTTEHTATNGRDEFFRLKVEAKPIKGTCARVQPSDSSNGWTEEERALDHAQARSLQASVKDRAENLMIVDLLRNDLSRVCDPGTVHVAKLMDIESFATVHQMVSTIRGVLDPARASALDVLRACFPGGSMTGAPKLRTMELLDEMEQGVCRGPYSGSLGYISLNGSMDMNILIRTAVLTPDAAKDGWKVSVGAGGAITALSESEDEYEEMMLKASVVMEAVEAWARSTLTTVNERKEPASAHQLLQVGTPLELSDKNATRC